MVTSASKEHPRLDFLGTRGLKGALVSRARSSLVSWGTIGLQGACASREHPGLDYLNATGRQAKSRAIGGTTGQVGMLRLGVYLVNGLPRQERAFLHFSV